MLFLLILVLCPAIAFTLIAVHELGHYLAGLAVGIPRDAMRIRLLRFPQHIAIRDGTEWVSPMADMARYIHLTRQHLTSRARAFAWIAGGLLLETTFLLLACAIAS